MAEVPSTRCSMCLYPSGIQQQQTKNPVQHITQATMDLMIRTAAVTEENATPITRYVAPKPLSNSSYGRATEAMALWLEDMDLME